MPASTSTITTSLPSKEPQTARLRTEKQTEQPPPLEVKEHDFFWTYTEEPHRTRRMAIIKAHPEVCFPSSINWHPCAPYPASISSQPSIPHPIAHQLQQAKPKSLPPLSLTGNQTLRSRTPYEIPRPPRHLHPDPMRLPAPRHALP